jgi:hypothetical protein
VDFTQRKAYLSICPLHFCPKIYFGLLHQVLSGKDFAGVEKQKCLQDPTREGGYELFLFQNNTLRSIEPDSTIKSTTSFSGKISSKKIFLYIKIIHSKKVAKERLPPFYFLKENTFVVKSKHKNFLDMCLDT